MTSSTSKCEGLNIRNQMPDWLGALQVDEGWKGLSTDNVLWRQGKWAWPHDVINFKRWMSISQEPNVPLSWNFTGVHKVASSIIRQSFVTSSKVGVARWHHQLQNVYVNNSGTKCPIDLKLCWPIQCGKTYHWTKFDDVIKSGCGLMTSSTSKCQC